MAVLSAPRVKPAVPAPMQGRWHGTMWVSAEPLAHSRLYLDCVASFHETGLWPVLIPVDARFADNQPQWFTHLDEMPNPAATMSEVSAEQFLQESWRADCCGARCLHPIGTEFPGVIRGSAIRNDPHAEAGNTGAVRVNRGKYRLGLVRTPRPADIPAIIGWNGMIKSTDNVAGISSVLRSWEDRFGATLVVLGFDELGLSVSGPPRNYSRALGMAAEHRAFSLPTFTGQPGNLRDYAEGLVRKRYWQFSWA